MGDERARRGMIQKPSILNLYKHRNYIDPIYSDWERWYAWYPIRKLEWCWIPEIGAYLKSYRWAWREDLLRRRVSSKRYHSSRKRSMVQWEHSTMTEMLEVA